jgi:hypothetical protein
MRGHSPAAGFADALCALMVLVVIAGGSLAIAVATRRAMSAFDADSVIASTYRAGDNPWSYAWSSGRDIGVPESSSNYAANAARQPAGMASDAERLSDCPATGTLGSPCAKHGDPVERGQDLREACTPYARSRIDPARTMTVGW